MKLLSSLRGFPPKRLIL